MQQTRLTKITTEILARDVEFLVDLPPPGRDGFVSEEITFRLFRALTIFDINFSGKARITQEEFVNLVMKLFLAMGEEMREEISPGSRSLRTLRGDVNLLKTTMKRKERERRETLEAGKGPKNVTAGGMAVKRPKPVADGGTNKCRKVKRRRTTIRRTLKDPVGRGPRSRARPSSDR